MHSLITILSHTHIPKSHVPSRLHYPVIPCRILTHNPQNKAETFIRPSGFTAAKTKRNVHGNFRNFFCWCERIDEVDGELEEDIMEFMEKSEKPMMFPTKEELLRGGRMDLVETIEERGGWYSLGWDEETNLGDNVEELDYDIVEFPRRVDNNSFSGHDEDNDFPSRETDADEVEKTKQRNSDFRINLDKCRDDIEAVNIDTGAEKHFKAAGTCFRKKEENNKGAYDEGIQTRLHCLEFELTTALHSLRSEREEYPSEEVIRSSSDLEKLSDAWEFKENELMTAQERLRSIRAKLNVLEGKMSLAISDAEKIVEEKQKRINTARKALKLLRTTCIVWPVLASEVFLAGSFDGWTTQRKMEKSRTGVFSVNLKLYPGRYEIKFIVDGKWKVDPLRPLINNNGYKNNLLVIT